ncbi:MAG: response regulator [Spirochaetota bacterium]
MEQVEEHLARLLETWDVDLYLRLDRVSAPGEPSLLGWHGLADGDATALATSPVVRDACERAAETTAPVIVTDVAAEVGDDSPLRELGVQTFVALTADSGSALLFGSRRAGSFPRSTLDLLRGFAAVVSSYTGERERGVGQLRRLVIRLTEAEDRERGRIAALLHDDLQQTLAGVKVHVDMAARRAGGDAFVAERLDTAVRLIEQAIDRSRTLSHELSPPMLKTRGLEAALRMLADEIGRLHGLRVDVESDAERVELSDFAGLVVYRAVQELLFNVVKHSGVDEATVGVSLDGTGLRLVVRDHGRGFDVDDALAGDTPTGLGLVSLRERVEAIGGALEIDSTPGSGSRFTIFLTPEAMRAEGTMPGRAGPAAEANDEARRATTVLLVDDHAVIRQGLAFLLNEEPDLEVVGEADTGTTALEMVRELMPDVVVMDLTMPGMSGDEATRRVLREAPETRVVGLSMHSDEEARERMLSAGAEAYLPKAGPSSELIAAIRGEDRD